MFVAHPFRLAVTTQPSPTEANRQAQRLKVGPDDLGGLHVAR
jgi:hypothetical protein